MGAFGLVLASAQWHLEPLRRVMHLLGFLSPKKYAELVFGKRADLPTRFSRFKNSRSK